MPLIASRRVSTCRAWFDAAIHYDLSWNPTRHQQREGRIDRFGQKSATVRSVLIYGENNPVDGAVLNVILRKARAIEKRTGVRVPIPDDNGSLTKALMSAVLLRAQETQQMTLDLDFSDSEEARQIELHWLNASENEKKSRTIFAQNALKPEEVAKEWDATQSALGGYDDTERFVIHAMTRLNAALTPLSSGAYRAPVHLTPETFRERFVAESLIEEASDKPIRIGFSARPPAGCISVHRAHPLPGVLAETFLEQALGTFAPEDDLAALPRTGAWECAGVDEVTWLAILRIRHKLNARGKLGPRFSMAEEAAAIAFSASSQARSMAGDDAFGLLEHDSDSLPEAFRQSEIERGLAALPSLEANLNFYAAERAEKLADDHTRVRQALGSRGSSPCRRDYACRCHWFLCVDARALRNLCMAKPAKRSRQSRRISRLDFAAIEIASALLPPEIVIRAATCDMPDQSDESYGVLRGLKLRDEIARYYQVALAHWERFSAARDGNVGAPQTFVLNLLKDCFGFAHIAETGTVILSERRFPYPSRLSQRPGTYSDCAAGPSREPKGRY